jgi:hypothetical protein
MTYRTLQRQFQLDDDALHDLTEELLYAHPEVRDDAGRGLVWTGDAGPAPVAPSAPVRAIQFSNSMPMRASASTGWAANRRQAAAMLV